MNPSESVLLNPVHETGNHLRAEHDPEHLSLFHLMKSLQFQFRTIEEAEKLAVFLANFFHDPDRVVQGLAELMINAIEHGNLGIGYDAKIELCRTGNWSSEIRQRLDSPAFRDQVAEIAMTRKDGGTYVVITDQGEGFDWKRYLKIDPARAGEAHGRGIAMANSISFDKLTYNESGNKAIAFVADSSGFEW